MTNDLALALTAELQHAAKAFGNELFFRYHDVTGVIETATQHRVAILGLEFFELCNDGLRTFNYTGYEFQFTGDWGAFVIANNEQALQFVEANRGKENEGYILTSTSYKEFSNLRVK